MDNEIAVVGRTAMGRKNRGLRRTGQVPGVVYGKGSESLPIQVDAKQFETLYRAAGRSSLVNLHIDSGRAQSAIIKSVQRDPLSGHALHVDFFLVDLTQEMEVDIPLVFTGEPPAVEQTGGTLMTPISRVRVKALPSDLPHELTIDVSGLVDLESALHARDLAIPDKVTLLTDPDELLARVLPPRVEEEEPVVAEEEGAEEGAEEGEAAEGAAEGEGEREGDQTEVESEG
jgi:large subunit ribosomal protein L25